MSVACLWPYTVTSVLYKLQELGTAWLCQGKRCVSLHNTVGEKWSLLWASTTSAGGPPEGSEKAHFALKPRPCFIQHQSCNACPQLSDCQIIFTPNSQNGFLICRLPRLLLAQAWEAVNFVGSARIVSNMTLSDWPLENLRCLPSCGEGCRLNLLSQCFLYWLLETWANRRPCWRQLKLL